MSAPKMTDAELGDYFRTVGGMRISSMYRAASGVSAIARVLQENEIGPDCRDDFEALSKRNVAGLLEAVDALSDYISGEAESLSKFGRFEAYTGERLPDREVQE